MAELPALTFKVKPDARRKAANGDTNVGRLAVQPILGLANWQIKEQQKLLSWLVYVLVLLPLIALIASFFYKQHTQRIGTDTAFARLNQADKKMNTALAQAKDFGGQGQIKEAYSAIYKALSIYIADCTNKPIAGLSDKEYVALASSHGLGAEKAKSLEQLLVKCSTIRFAPNTSIDDLNADIRVAENLAKELKSAIKA